MSAYRQVIHKESGQVLLPQARWCNTFLTKLGFSFKRRLEDREGLVLVEKHDNRVNSSVTMLFTFFDLGVIWVNHAGEIVDTVVAKPWRLSYVPQAPARYAIEGHPDILKQVQLGDHIEFMEVE